MKRQTHIFFVLFIFVFSMDISAVASEKLPQIWVEPFNGEKENPLRQVIPELLEIYFSQDANNIVVDRQNENLTGKELELDAKGMLSQKNSLDLGKQLSATILITGGFIEQDSQIKINAHAYDVATARLLVSQEVHGDKENLADLVFKLHLSLGDGLTRSLPALSHFQLDKTAVPNLHFMKGLSFYYSQKYSRALSQFMQASTDPNMAALSRWWMAKTYLSLNEFAHAYAELSWLAQSGSEKIPDDEVKQHLMQVAAKLSPEHEEFYRKLFEQ